MVSKWPGKDCRVRSWGQRGPKALLEHHYEGQFSVCVWETEHSEGAWPGMGWGWRGKLLQLLPLNLLHVFERDFLAWPCG